MTIHQKSPLNITKIMVTKRMVQHLYIQNKEKNFRKHNLSSYISMKMRVQRRELTVKFMYRDSGRQVRQSFFPSIRSTFDNQVVFPDIFDYSDLIIKVHSLKPTQRLFKPSLTQAKVIWTHLLTQARKLRRSGKEIEKKDETNAWDKVLWKALQLPNALYLTFQSDIWRTPHIPYIINAVDRDNKRRQTLTTLVQMVVEEIPNFFHAELHLWIYNRAKIVNRPSQRTQYNNSCKTGKYYLCPIISVL